MLELTIPDMTCGHCMNVITRAVHAIDGDATLAFDLPSHRVRVESGSDAQRIRAAIEEAGYAVDATPKAANCCGSCST